MTKPTTLIRQQCAILPLVLKGKWYDMIERGEKREEYRLANTYWQKRFWNWHKASLDGSKAPVVEFRRGYAANAPRMAFWVFGMATASGMLPYAAVFPDDDRRDRRPEWGEPEEAHFVIQLGGRVELVDSTGGVKP